MKFDISTGKIRVSPETLMLGCLREIWDDDESPAKSEANDILLYIHICAKVDEEAPFFASREDEVRILARDNVWYKRECPYNLNDLEKAITEYSRSKEQPETRILKIYNDKLDKIQDTIGTIIPEVKEVKDSRGTFKGYATNLGMLTKIMRELDPLLADKEKLKNRIKKISAEENTFRAGRTRNMLEERIIKTQRNAQAQQSAASADARAGTTDQSQPQGTQEAHQEDSRRD